MLEVDTHQVQPLSEVGHGCRFHATAVGSHRRQFEGTGGIDLQFTMVSRLIQPGTSRSIPPGTW